MPFDHRFWRRRIREQFIPYLDLLQSIFRDRLMPAFGDIAEQADAVTEAEYQRLGSMPADDYSDMSDAAEAAQDAGINYYESHTAAQQAFSNLTAVGLHHAFEQQLLLFHRREVLEYHERDERRLFDIKIFSDRLKTVGIDLKALPSYATVEQLRHAANTIKHADGHSAELLKGLRPDLFTHPALHEESAGRYGVIGEVYGPLMGEDLFVTEAALAEWFDGCRSFWHELGEALRE